MASVRSLLAKWLGGAGAPPHAGIRSLLAKWLGGAGAETVPTDVECGGSADVARTRSYEASGGGVFNGSAVVTQISGAQDFSVVVAFPGPLQPQEKPVEKPEPRKRRIRQTYSYVPDGGLELSASAIVSRSRGILASGGLALRAEHAASRVRSICSAEDLIVSGSADVATYDAIYDTEDEEIALMMMASAA